ncbi:hypothetical protein OZL92_22600 [Bacillus sonorensis]|uniref:Uncharacterized protein n=1 Tax=Bacillus sonorensis L12 TaxID=1274524 RepID=M5P7G3_9BACI|nr:MULTISPECIES: hypothetical protein [Bacillus subtilis group]NWO07552.1 hypothetical protein [Alteromonadaceae bacterium]EME75373.1 hypothetical protein BSONL12_06033 [Bacillus sonorensis L12]MCZ0075007.1 hypothetical protein [Bacillus sonorensis]MCZ0094115.1 hypothetical protein [Bacillus sonorensis]MDE1415103.1 hypothetical protein [Bacillus licheniformis]
MKKVWLVVTQYRDVDEYEDKEILATFTEKEDRAMLEYLGDIVTSKTRFLEKIFELDLLKGELSEMDLKLSNGKLCIEKKKA